MTESSTIDLVWILICCVLVMTMQIGFLCLESGLTRTKNSINVAIKNIVDFGFAVMIFWAFGYGLSFGESWNGLLGTTDWFFKTDSHSPHQTVVFIFQLLFCGTAITIVSGAVAERMRFAGYIIIACIVSGIIYPIFSHWAWNNSGTNSG